MPVISGLLWEHLFGRTDRFAILLGLGSDPGLPTFGRIEIHVQGSCVTLNQHGILGLEKGVTWDLVDLLRWISSRLPRIVKGDEFPFTLPRTPTAAAWLVDSLEEGPIGRTEQEEDDWFGMRSDYWAAHSLASMDGVAVPDLVLRRVLNAIEISWTSRLGNVRKDIRWLEADGAVRMPVPDVVGPLVEAAEALADLLGPSLDEDLQKRVRLLRRETAKLKFRPFSLAASGVIERPTREDNEALALLLQAARTPSTQPVRFRPRAVPPELTRPWLGGYRLAQEYREEMGWNHRPIPSLEDHLAHLGIDVGEIELSSPDVHGVSLAGEGYRPSIRVNVRSKRPGRDWSRQMLLAHELCHLLYDWRSGEDFSIISSERADWPTEARANAFAAELVMPRDGIAELVRGRMIDYDVVQEVMERFTVGVQAAARHLRNLRLIDKETRLAILEEHGRRQRTRPA